MDATPTTQLSEFRRGVHFQRYQLLEHIGAGGQGVVWSAVDQARQRVVAIKFNEVFKSDQNMIDDMVIKGQADKLISLRHPHVLTIYDIGSSGQLDYQVSPYICGGSLLDRLESGPLKAVEALNVATQIASALDYLHGQALIHRDLKPSNILLDLNRNVYVSDFGLARVVSATTSAMHTGRGTPPYSPPEQHSMAKMTPQSDIFSFGVMLYVIFTGQLPWNGEKVLGMQQLYSKDVMPDPAEINPELPPSLVYLLRFMTAAEPTRRPASAGEAMRMIAEAFGIAPVPGVKEKPPNESGVFLMDVQGLLRQALANWEPSHGTIAVSLTKFALLDLALAHTSMKPAPAKVQHFMLVHALTFGYNDDFWWKEMSPPDDRLAVALALVKKDIETIPARVVNQLVKDPDLCASKSPRLPELTTALLDIAANANDPFLRGQSLEALQALIPAGQEWRQAALRPEQDQALVDLALGDSPQSEEAARLIGHLRSRQAVHLILKEPDDDRRIPALLAIQHVAGNLPDSTPFQVRAGVAIESVVRRLLARPLRLLAVYVMSAAGAALGWGLPVYLLYRWPAFLDYVRITLALERGVFMGVAFGFGLFLTRLLVERIPGRNALQRKGLATIVGGVVLNLAVFLYDILMLQTSPSGILITIGCCLIAFGFAFGPQKRRLWRIILSFVMLYAVLIGSWWGSIQLAASFSSVMSPVMYYESARSFVYVLGMALIPAAAMATLGNLGGLSLQEE